jgi:hypothetical protein
MFWIAPVRLAKRTGWKPMLPEPMLPEPMLPEPMLPVAERPVAVLREWRCSANGGAPRMAGD